MTPGEKRRWVAMRLGLGIFGLGIAKLVWAGTPQGPCTIHSTGGYAVTFPGWTLEVDKAQQTSYGKFTVHRAYYKDSDTDLTCYSEYNDFGSNNGNCERATVGGLVQAVGPQLSGHPIELDGWHGEEVVFETQNAHRFTARVFIGKVRTYIVMEGVPDSVWAPGRKSEFLDSFHFEKQ
jgi:hypothetical protein